MASGKSRSLARNLLAPVRQTFNQLIDDGVVASNPASRMGQYLKTRVDPRSEIAFLTPDEEDALLSAALRHAPRAYPLLLCALRTGLRFGELLGLQWDDVDERGRFIEVRRTLRDGQEDGRVALPKNGRIRRVDLSGQLVEELRRLRVERSREALANGWGAQPWVFVSSEGRPLFKANFARRYSIRCSRRPAGAGYASMIFGTRSRRGCSERRVAGLRERADGPRVDQDHRRHLRPPYPWFQQGGRGPARHDRTQPSRNRDGAAHERRCCKWRS